MNETNLYHETLHPLQLPGWICDLRAFLSDSVEEIFAEEEQEHLRFGEILEQHAWEKGNLTCSPPTLDGISSLDLFGNGSVEEATTEGGTFPIAEGSSFDFAQWLALWDMSDDKQSGQDHAIQLGEAFPYRRSNALIRRYTQWHTVHPHAC